MAPRFEGMAPELIIVGGGKHKGDPKRFMRDTGPFIEAIEEENAGRILLDKTDEREKVHKDLHRAAKVLGFRLRTTWIDDKTLAWKRIKTDFID